MKHTAAGARFIGFEEIAQPIQPHFSALGQYLETQVNAFEPEIQELVRYCVLNQGKRIRSVLLFLSGFKGEDVVIEEQVMASAVIELVHLATLVHDDILDDATMRRNRPTADNKYGSKIAVLLGDALFSHALKLASEFDTTEVCRHVAEATRQVCTGEIEQIFERGNVDLSLDRYFRLIDLKTARLFDVSGRLGALTGGYSREFAEVAAEVGRRLGVAYQVFDDWSDLVSEEAIIGKTLGTDIATGKYTLPVILLSQRMSDGERSSWRARAENKAITVAELREAFERFEVGRSVQGFFDAELDHAQQILKPYKELPSFVHLQGLIDGVRSLMGHVVSV